MKQKSRKMKKVVRVTDSFQKKYTYTLTEPIGQNFALDFHPELTPKQMMKLGVFGGYYFADRPKEFPKEWFSGVKLAAAEPDARLNFFKINASQPLKVWQKKGWIFADDPRGWFQWYCRYYMGRRLPEEDRRQINRWKAIKRHIKAVEKNCKKGELTCRPRQRQAILHWAYDSRKI